jgi:hypothetical protein
MSLDLKKIYYYVIALITFFVLLWGVIDFVSVASSLTDSRYLPTGPAIDKNAEPGPEDYYQKRVAQDRLFDSLTRIIVSGGIFLYAKIQANKMEKG